MAGQAGVCGKWAGKARVCAGVWMTLVVAVSGVATTACGQSQSSSPQQVQLRGQVMGTCAPYDGPAFRFEVVLSDGRTLKGMVTDPLPGGASAKSWGVASTSQPHGLGGAVCTGTDRATCKQLASGTLRVALRDDGFLGKFALRLESGEEVEGVFHADPETVGGSRPLCG